MGAEQCPRRSQRSFNPHWERVRATHHAPRGPCYLRERRHGLAEVVERGGCVVIARDPGALLRRDHGHVESETLGWEFTWTGRPEDGMQVESILYSADRKAQVTLPSHFWSKHSIERALQAAGFEAITWEELAADKGAPEAVATTRDPMPVGVFTARLA